MNEERTPDVGLDRLLTDWLHADAAPRAPESLETAFVEAVARTRQRPAWATTERWISMETRAQLGVMPRVVIVLLTLALLAIGAVGGYALGSGLVKADGDGEPTAGLTYHTREGVIYQHPVDGTGERVPLTGADEHASTLAWSPDGTRFAYLSWPDDGLGFPPTIMIRDADGSNPVVIGERRSEGDPGYFAWSPDGSTILYWADGLDVVDEDYECQRNLPFTFCGQRIWSAASDGSEPPRMIGDPSLDARAPLWTPDGESIIFAGSAAGSGTDHRIYRMDADGANVERIGDLGGDGRSLSRPSLSPDGTQLAVTIDNGTTDDIYLVDLAAGDESLIASGDESKFGPLWSPDGSLLAYTTMHPWSVDALQRVMLYDVASGETISLGEPGEVVSWSPDGRYIATWLDGVLGVLDVSDPTAPVAIEIEGATEADGPNWPPRP